MADLNIGTENLTGVTRGMPLVNVWVFTFTTAGSTTWVEGDLDDWTWRFRVYEEEHSTTTVFDKTGSDTELSVVLTGSTSTAVATLTLTIASATTAALSRSIKSFYRLDALDAEGETQARIQGKFPIET